MLFDKDVCRLNISMNYFLCMCIIKGIKNLGDNSDRGIKRQDAFWGQNIFFSHCKRFCDREPLNQLHSKKEEFFCFSDFIYLDNVWMRQNGCWFRFLAEQIRCLLGEKAFGEYFDRNLSFQWPLIRNKNNSHATAGQLFYYSRCSELPADKMIYFKFCDWSHKNNSPGLRDLSRCRLQVSGCGVRDKVLKKEYFRLTTRNTQLVTRNTYVIGKQV